MPIVGIIIITSTIMPSPPIQWLKLRQNNTERGRDSTSFSIEAPVVVKPEVDSKNASINDGIDPLIRKGSDPRVVRIIQEMETARKASLLLIFSPADFLENMNRIMEMITEIKDDHRKGSADSLYTIATGRQTRNEIDSIKMMVLRIRIII